MHFFKNGTKESISKLVSDLNSATLEPDVGKSMLLFHIWSYSHPLWTHYVWHVYYDIDLSNATRSNLKIAFNASLNIYASRKLRITNEDNTYVLFFCNLSRNSGIVLQWEVRFGTSRNFDYLPCWCFTKNNKNIIGRKKLLNWTVAQLGSMQLLTPYSLGFYRYCCCTSFCLHRPGKELVDRSHWDSCSKFLDRQRWSFYGRNQVSDFILMSWKPERIGYLAMHLSQK